MTPDSARYPFREESQSTTSYGPDELFDRLDDPGRLGAHMSKPSVMMLGGWMRYDLGSERGKGLGARMDFSGCILGFRIAARQLVVDYTPPWRKVWETDDQVRLFAIGPYRLGFEIVAVNGGAGLRLFIDYTYPSGWLGGLRGALLARPYARWCLRSMMADAALPIALRP